MGIGYGLRGLASGFQTGLGLDMERRKLNMIQEEQKRAEKLAKDKEDNAMNWYNTNKDSLTNFQTQPQDIRNMLIFESTKYSDDWNDYLRDSEKALQAGDLEELKHLNDIAEEKIKAERDMLDLGITAENGFIGKHYNEKDMDYVKKLRMGALTNKPIGTAMYEERFGKLPVATEQPKLVDYNTGLKYLTSIVNVSPENWNSAKKNLETKYGLDYSSVTQEALKSGGIANEREPTPTAFKTLQAIKDSFKNVKTKAEYDEAVASYDTSKEAKASDWTPPPFENQLTTLLKKVENAIWADYVNKDTGKLKNKNVWEEYNVGLQHYLRLIEEARNAGMDISQFQAFIPFKSTSWGLGNMSVITESW